jgi:hypothetical protein
MAYFADILQYVHGELQVANMECRQRQSDMAEMPIAILQPFAARFADSGFAGYSLDRASISHVEHNLPARKLPPILHLMHHVPPVCAFSQHHTTFCQILLGPLG